jgi:hypothetical protein
MNQETVSSPTPGSQLTAPKLLKASPQHEGYVMKLHVSPFYSLFPQCLQRLIARISLFSFLAPSWERRYLILVGSFLYKFVDNSSNKGPKGSPFSLESIEVRLCTDSTSVDDIGLALDDLPPAWTNGVFTVSTLRKKHYYAAATREQAQMWISALRDARHEAIKRSLGHAPADSYPKSWEYYDSLGKGERDRKDRIHAKMEEQSLREMEMVTLGGAGGPIPQGYYG